MAKAKPITGLDIQAPTAKNAAIIAHVRLEELYDWSKYADIPYAVRELHNMRIAGKRLRYTLEVFEDALPRACEAIRQELEQLQEELGQLHDSDVRIALMRLCLGNQESGPIYQQAFSEAQQHQDNSAKSFLPPQLLALLLDPDSAPSAEERYGLEQFLRKQEEIRQEHYETFRQHWYRLQQQDMRRQLLDILDTVQTRDEVVV